MPNHQFLDIRQIFTADEQRYLSSLSQRLPLSFLTASERNKEEIGIDLIYSSAQLSGNSYDIHDALTLLKIRKTAGGKPFTDASMLIELLNDYSYLLACLTTPEPFNWEDCIQTLNGTEHIPLVRLERLSKLVSVAQRIESPFDQALYLHNNLAYLQFNKRTARNSMASSLMRAEIFPCIFSPNSHLAYSNALLEYCETGKYRRSKEYFITSYENTVAKYEYKPDPQIIRVFHTR